MNIMVTGRTLPFQLGDFVYVSEKATLNGSSSLHVTKQSTHQQCHMPLRQKNDGFIQLSFKRGSSCLRR